MPACAHKLYPQAAPNAYAIEKLGIAPCRDACPAGQRAQGYIALIREGRYHDAGLRSQSHPAQLSTAMLRQ